MIREVSAGGVVYKKNNHTLRIQMVQDRFGKMTLAKGKMEPGETVEQTALREIEEETGIVATITEPLGIVNYQFETPQRGLINKEVHYFLMEAIAGTLQAQVEEITGVEWVSLEEVWTKQINNGYDNNDSVLKKALLKLGYKV